MGVDMEKKQESEFKTWFIEQHGRRPSPMQSHELQSQVMQADEAARKARRLLERCDEYDARETSALYAWRAARMKGEK